MKNISILTVLLFIVFASNSQTASLAKLYAKPGDTIYMPVTALEFNNIGAVGFYINYDKNVLDYVGVVNVNQDISSILYNNSDNILKLGWYSTDAVSSITADNSKLFDIKFVYKGGNTVVSFDTEESLIGDIDGLNNNNTSSFINGFVYPLDATGINVNSNSSYLNLYPNPTDGLVNVTISNNRIINNISLFDVEGKEIYNSSSIKLANTSVNLSNNAPGVYFLRIECKDDILYRKVIKE